MHNIARFECTTNLRDLQNDAATLGKKTKLWHWPFLCRANDHDGIVVRVSIEDVIRYVQYSKSLLHCTVVVATTHLNRSKKHTFSFSIPLSYLPRGLLNSFSVPPPVHVHTHYEIPRIGPVQLHVIKLLFWGLARCFCTGTSQGAPVAMLDYRTYRIAAFRGS